MQTRRRHSRFATAPLLLALVGALGACDGEGGAAKADGPDAAAAAASGVEAALEKAVENGPEGAKVKGEVKTFIKNQRKLGCEMLTPALAAKTLQVPEGELEQLKVMGCIYNWESADKSEVGEASIMSIWVKKDADQARTWFENSTKNLTKEDVEAQMKMVQEMAKKRKEIDTKMKEKTVDQVGGMMAAMTPEAGIQYEDVEGVGDAARVKIYDGSLTVLVGNMIFNVRAFKGIPSEQPDIDIKAFQRGDTKAVMEASKKVEREWMDKTRDVRKKMAIELAKEIVAGL